MKSLHARVVEALKEGAAEVRHADPTSIHAQRTAHHRERLASELQDKAIVPREASEKMLLAGVKALDRSHVVYGGAVGCYRAMLEASDE